MVYINSWQEYQEAAEGLYAESPRKTRYSVKWKSSEGKLVLKITDDVTFKTHSSIFLGRFEALNRTLIQKMTNTRPPAAAPVHSTLAAPPPRAGTASPVPRSSAGTPALPDTPVQAPAPSGGGVKKKKKGKR
ncbi:signal recognition particle, SRP9/SRP14 subunit [Gloeopeniophorella convolvens]|nr:signal recognition particle, SRP9/SRP14 subunit [Gloeopeniophorella convolvens]